MSISDQAGRAAAVEKLKAASPEQLRQDLEYWSVSSRDHVVEYQELTNRRSTAHELYSEAEGWVALITDELRGRRSRPPRADA